MPYDLFISYSRHDNEQGRITELVERIEADFAAFEGMQGRELRVFFDQQEIHGMQDWRQRILQGLRESRLLLACLSPSYLKSEYCQWEFVEYLKYEIGHLHGFNGVAPIYFVEVPGWDNKDFEQQCAAWIAELRKRQHFDLRTWHDQGEAALRETAVQERMGKLNRQIVQTITRGERAEKSLGNVDAHNPHFIGRTANLRLLRENFVKPGHIGVVTAVNGVGGLGKTALAIEYAHAFADEYGGGRWQVRCAGKDDLRLALAELATPIGFEFTDNEKKNADLQFERTRHELKKLADARTPHRCLLLLDNVDRPGLLDPAQVAQLNGGDWLHVLATTRLGENELHGAHRDRSFLAVDELPPDDALALIESYQPDGRFRSEAERDAAREIVRLLGSFTLAVESAAVYLGQFANDVTCAAFLARLKKEGLEGLDTAASQSDVSVRHGENRLGATLQPTLERLGAPEKLALEFAALLPPDQVPLPWLRALVAKTFPEMERDAEPGYPDPWKNVSRRLLSLRLINATNEVDHDGQPCLGRVHRLMVEMLINRLPTEELDARQQSVKAVLLKRGTELTKTTNWKTARWEIEPLDRMARLLTQRKHSEGPFLLAQVGVCWIYLAEWTRAEPLLRQVLLVNQNAVVFDPTATIIGLNNLAQLLFETHRFAEAEALMRQALAIAKEKLSPEDAQLAATLNNLAELLRATNRFKEAESCIRRALVIDEKQNHIDPSAVARDLANLAMILEQTDRVQEAEVMVRKALAIDEAARGEGHPTVAIHLNHLASLLTEPREAERLFRRALVINEQSYGSDHPTVSRDLNNLAFVLQSEKRFEEAEQMRRRGLAIEERIFPHGHPRVAMQLSNLATLLKERGGVQEAETLYRRALAIDEKCLGPNHPDVARDLNNLGLLMHEIKRDAEAEPLMYRGIVILRQFCSLPSYARYLDMGVRNYIDVLQNLGCSREQIRARIRQLVPELLPIDDWLL